MTPFQFYQQYIKIGLYECKKCETVLEGRQELDRHVKEHVGSDVE